MKDRRSKALDLIARFNFTDLARAVAKTGVERRKFLEGMAQDSFNPRTYKPFREVAPSIYGVERPLDLSPPPDREEIVEAVKRHVKRLNRKDRKIEKQIETSNVETSKLLFDLVRPRDYKAYPHPPQALRTGIERFAPINLDFYIVDGDRAVFQFPQPRKSLESSNIRRLMLSIIHHAYVQGDFREADVELADLSQEVGAAPDWPREREIRGIAKDDIIDRKRLGEEIQSVQDILIDLTK